MATEVKVWDPVVRFFHWSLVVAFTLNATIIDDDAPLHATVGYVVLALVGFRLVWGLLGTTHARFADFPPDARGAAHQLRSIVLGRRARHVGHSPLGALMIYNLLLTMLLLGATGWAMTLPESVIGHDPEWAEELHEGLFAWALFSIVVHVGAVLFETARTRVNLVRAMFTGRKTFDDD
jgi:cytochrome b